MEGQLLERIRNSSLKGENAAIARMITSNLHKVAFLTGSQLAKECAVSVSTITRFSQKLGYDGFPDLKRDLEGLYRKTTTPYEMFESYIKKSSKNSVVDMSLSQDVENIESIKLHFNEKEFKKIIKWIQNAEKVHLTGIASSEILVDYMDAFLKALDKPTNPLKSFGVTKVAELTDFDSSHLLIGFSFQRILKEVRDLFVYVRQFGVKTVAVTDSPINALAVEADAVLVAPVIGTTFGLSHAAPLAMVNALANGLASEDKDMSLKILKKAKEEWETRPIFVED